MKKINICWVGQKNARVDTIRYALKYDEREYGFEFIYDEEKPEYIIVSEILYYYRECQNQFLNYFKNNPIVIAFPTEFIVPDMNFIDYAIVWDRNLKMDDRIYRKPTMLYYENMKEWEDNKYQICRSEIAQNKKFCNFIYSNGNAHPFRDQLFYELNHYKRVESLGKHLNNMGNVPTRNDKNWLAQSIDLKSRYKFSISCNNHYFVGGIDEKLLTSLAARSVPIFWGDPTVEEEFNPKVMINCHNYDNMEKIIEAVKEIDQNDELWLSMVSQPWQTDEQKSMTEIEMAKYRKFLTNIFAQDKKDARRAGEGSARDLYMKWFAHDDKYQVYFYDLIRWINIKNSGKMLDDYLEKENYHTVAIYGFGEVGKCLFNELKNSKVKVKYAIDQNAIHINEEIQVLNFSEHWEEVDAIIVTPTSFFENIKIQISAKCPYNVISLNSILNSI